MYKCLERRVSSSFEESRLRKEAMQQSNNGGGSGGGVNSELAFEAGGEKEEGDLHGCPCESYTLLLLTI